MPIISGSLDKGVLEVRTPLGCVVGRDAAQSILNATVTVLNFNVDHFDPYGMHDPVTNNSRLIAPVSGLYLVWADVLFALSGAGDSRVVYIRPNGGGTGFVATFKPASGVATGLTITGAIKLTGGEYVEVFVSQDSGGALDISLEANGSPRAGMVLLGGFR